MIIITNIKITNNEIETDEIKATIYKRFLSVKYNNRLCAWISYNRKILRVHLPLNPDSYQEYKPQNFSTMKTYKNNPYTLKLNTKVYPGLIPP